MNGCEIQELNTQVDHVHMAIQISSSISVNKVIQSFKSVCSRIIREEIPEVKKYFWADGYFSETFGTGHEQAILNYIGNQ